jgi:hypothetical protein
MGPVLALELLGVKWMVSMTLVLSDALSQYIRQTSCQAFSYSVTD